jgi:hypothetical protein
MKKKKEHESSLYSFPRFIVINIYKNEMHHVTKLKGVRILYCYIYIFLFCFSCYCLPSDYTLIIVVVIVKETKKKKTRENKFTQELYIFFSGNIEHSTRIDKLNERIYTKNNNKNNK